MLEQDIARALLEIEAVQFRPDDPVTFKSGMISPVYVDNRRLIFHPHAWSLVIEGFRAHIAAQGLAFDVIAGIEAAGIPHSSVLAYTLGAPSVFVRKQAKEHGLKSAVEGGDVTGQRVLLVEDMVTTGGSSLKGVESLRAAGATVTDCLAITSYGFAMSRQAFEVMGVRLHALVSFPVIVDEALAQGRFDADVHRIISAWLDNPHQWGAAL